jgi:hypothetical protein
MAIQTALDSISNSSGSPFGFKNRIINGDMRIDQRNAGASSQITDAYYLDRWQSEEATDGTMSIFRDTVAPSGFTNSLKVVTTGADASLGATQYVWVRHHIEGYNVADLAWGTVNAATVTISFWVRSSLTGTFGGSLVNGSVNRYYVFSYSISSADTWEKKSITIPGDTTGTWWTDNQRGITLIFGLGVGSTYSGTAGSWTNSVLFAPTGAVSVIGTSNATWQITGVQLEKGSAATAFDYRDYGRELAMCQRYYARIYDIWCDSAVHTGGGRLAVRVAFPVSTRAIPTITNNNVAAVTCSFQGTNRTNYLGTHLYANSTSASGDVFFVVDNMEISAEL